MLNVKELKIGTEVEYSFFKNITFEGTDEQNEHVILKDKNGNPKKVYISLFEKYGRVVSR